MDILMLVLIVACGSGTSVGSQRCKLQMIKCFNETKNQHKPNYKGYLDICLEKKLKETAGL